MAVRIITFVLGVWLFQFSPELPPSYLFLIPLVVISLTLRWSEFMFPALFVLGLSWAAGHGYMRALERLPPEHEGQEVILTGVVASIPSRNPHRSRFLFNVEGLELEGLHYPGPGKVRLSWYKKTIQLAPGQQWTLVTKLRRPRGTFNPGTFNYEAWLYQQGINASGYVIRSDRNRKVDERFIGYLFQRLRFYLFSELTQYIEDERALGLVLALIIGKRSGIDDTDWETFRATGTNHLFAISGLHIGIVAGLFFLLGKALWRLSPGGCLWLPAPKFAACLALVTAFLYAGLAGFAIPTQRALIMLAVILGSNYFDRNSSPLMGLCWALLAVVLYDPLAPLSFGFWLSFAAVLSILMALQWQSTGQYSPYRAAARLQWAVFFGLAPLLLMMGLGVSFLAPFINLLVVPIFSLLLVPWLFAALLLMFPLPPLGQWLLELASEALLLQVDVLAKIASFDAINLYHAPLTPVVLIVLGIAFLLCLLPRGAPGRSLYGLFFLPILAVSPSRPNQGDFWVTQLDVGQGLSLVITTQNHLLLYDTGPRFPGGFDAGESVVVPYLKQAGYSTIDRIILSNGDMDHRGGYQSVLNHFNVLESYSGEPERIKHGSVGPCYAGQKWQWDGVRFEVLHPSQGATWKGNNASCVVKISNSSGQFLITGDIERAAERSLLKQDQAVLQAAVTTVPHHGSKSSSSEAFTHAVGANIALVSAGYGNRYGFPRQQVVSRWQATGSTIYNAFDTGAIAIQFSQASGISKPQLYRQVKRRYWMMD